MAKTFTAPFAQAPKTGIAVSTTATASIDTTPTNTTLLVTAGADGALVTRLWAIPRATVTATTLYLFLSKDGGTTLRLVDTELMAAHTVATTTAIPETSFGNYSESTPFRLEAADRLYVGVGVTLSNGIVFKAEFTDF
jgi:hypothetical protein